MREGKVSKIKKMNKYLKRLIVLALVFALASSGLSLSAEAKIKKANRIPVITYHNILDDHEMDYSYTTADGRVHKYKGNSLVVSKSTFDAQMKWLKKNGYTTISCEEFYKWHQGKIELPVKSILITFDDGKYSFYKYALPILKKYKMRATMFAIGKYAEGKRDTKAKLDRLFLYDYMSGDLIKKAKRVYKDNCEFYSHSYDLHKTTGEKVVVKGRTMNMGRMVAYSTKELNRDFRKMRYNQSGIGYKFMAYPFGEYMEGWDDRSASICKSNGVKMAFQYSPTSRAWASRGQGIYHIKRIKIDGSWKNWKKEFKSRLG